MASTTKRTAIRAAAGAAGLIGLAYLSAFLPGGAPAWAPWALATGTAALMVALMALGAARSGRPLGVMKWALAFTFVVVAGGLGLALALPAEGVGTRLWLGLPARAAIVLYGVGLLPTLVLPLAYALTFDRLTLTDEDVARVKGISALGPRPSAGSGAAGVTRPASPGTGPRAEDSAVSTGYRRPDPSDAAPTVPSVP
jgi:hypothetical protein